MNQSETLSNSVASRNRGNNLNSQSHFSYSNAMNQTHSQSKNQNAPHLIGLTNSNIHTSSITGNSIYGTTINQNQVKIGMEAFIHEFEVTCLVNEQEIPEKIYQTQLIELDLNQSRVFTIQGRHLKQYDRQLYYQFIYFPTQMLVLSDSAIKDCYRRMFIDSIDDQDQIFIRSQRMERLTFSIRNLEESVSLKEIDQKQINRLISVRGIVIRTSDIIPQMKTAHFKCLNCKSFIIIQLIDAKVEEPKTCQRCKMKGTLQIQHNLGYFQDKQHIKFQELPEYVPQGETPTSCTVIAYDYNVDGLRPGDRVQIVGIYRVSSTKTQKNRKALRSVYNTYIDAISFNRVHEKILKIQDQNIVQIAYNDDDKNMFYHMADSPTILADLANAFAPSIYGHDEVKKGLLAQLFGGTKKDFNKLGRGRWRSDINICLVGDPSTAKSQLLQQVHKIAARGIYTSGRGSSAVGLTANVRKDPQTKQFVLQSGALVLSDLGICCIDEFDKMDPQSRLILLEAMEQQTISIAKAGIVCQLNSRTAILCAANPVNSRYNSKKSVVENINLEPALLTRFDLIYILLDQPNEAFDRMLASHILNLYSQFDRKLVISEKQTVYSKQILTKYITFAKQYVHPVLDERSADKLVEAYSDMRKIGNNKKVITATTRQLESLIRISQAFAKMRLSKVVEERDVDQAIALVKFATQQAATDPTTGLIDMDVLVTGKTSSTRRKISRIKDIIWQMIRANVGKYKKTCTIDGLKPDVEKKLDIGDRASDQQIVEALKMLESEGLVNLFGPSKHKPNFRLGKDIHNL